jgi:hypothetical protein
MIPLRNLLIFGILDVFKGEIAHGIHWCERTVNDFCADSSRALTERGPF